MQMMQMANNNGQPAPAAPAQVFYGDGTAAMPAVVPDKKDKKKKKGSGSSSSSH